jgi:hypothetical protein
VTADDQPYCGAELLPHATFPDGSLAPTVCDRPVHAPGSMHHNDEDGAWWRWQDAAGNWL